MFSVVTVCYDWEIHQPYIESVKGFKTRESAWEWACSAAEEEVDCLNQDCDVGISFGIPEGEESYQCGSLVKVCYYYEDNTEIVTKRHIIPIEEMSY